MVSTLPRVLFHVHVPAAFVHWTTPLTSSLPPGTLADLASSKAELLAEHALLRQPLINLKRQVKRPACTWRDRILHVLLAQAVRAWKQTLFIVPPETLLTLASGALPPVLEAQVKGLFSQAQGSRANQRINQREMATENRRLRCRAHSRGTPETG